MIRNFHTNITSVFIFLEELCDEGVIDVFEMTEAIILLRKKYKMPVIDIYGKKTIIPATKKLGKELIKEAS